MPKSVSKAKTARNAKSAAKKPVAKRAAKPAKQDIITSSTVSADGGHIVIVNSTTGEMFTRPKRGDSKEFRSVSAVGQSFDAAQRWHNANPVAKPTAKLARGIEPRTAPHSAKAVADQPREAAKPAKGKAAATGKNAKPRTEKAGANKQPSRGANRTYKLGKRKDESKPGTFRRYMLTTIMSHKDTDSAKAAHAKSKQYPSHKLDFNWAAQQGYIILSK